MKSWQKYVLAFAPLIIIGLIVYFFTDIVTYVILAWVLSMVGAPVYRLLNRFFKPNLASALTLLVFTLFFILLVRVFVPPLFQQARNFADVDYNKLVAGLDEPIEDVNNWLIRHGILDESVVTEKDVHGDGKHTHNDNFKTTIVRVDSLLAQSGDTTLKTGINLLINFENRSVEYKEEPTPQRGNGLIGFFEEFKGTLKNMINPSQISKVFSSFLGFLGGFVILVMSVLFITFFFLKESGLFTRMVTTLVPDKDEGKVAHAIDESSQLLIRYFIGLIIQIFIITVLTSLILKLLGFQNPLLMAFLFALLNLIPYIGPIMGNLFGVIIVVSSNLDAPFYSEMLPLIIKAIVVFAIVQVIDNMILQPNIFSKSVKAHPLEIFLVILVGAKLGGILGMVLAIPAYTVIRVLLKVFFSEFKVVQRMTRGI